VYLKNSPGHMQAMLSAIDEEMNRCLAELRMLGSEMGNKEQKFKNDLNTVTKYFNYLNERVKASEDLVVSEAVNMLCAYVNSVNETIQSYDFSSDDEWKAVLGTVKNLYTRIETMSVISKFSGNIHAVCIAILDGLRPVNTFQSERNFEEKGERMLLLLKNIGINLEKLKKGDFYQFLNNGVLTNHAQKTPEDFMMDIIQVLLGAHE
jgi:hypothetical protein